MAKTKFIDSAGREAWKDKKGMVYTEGGSNPTNMNVDQWNKRQQDRWGSQQSNLANQANEQLLNEISNIITEFESNLDSIPIGLTTEEMDNFLQKAIEQITPYYENKKQEIETGIKEGKIRNAEDILTSIRTVQEETNTLLKKYDVQQARTDEELAQTLADITTTRDEDIALKQADWKQRIDTAKQEQVQTGVLTSGVGKSKIRELLERQGMEEATIQRRAGTKQTAVETAKKYDLQTIALARQSAEQERVRRIGTPEQTQVTEAGARGTLGLGAGAGLPSEMELARLRSERGITPRRVEELPELEEERKRAIESRKLELQEGEKAVRAEEERRKRQDILSKLSSQYSQIQSYR